MSYRTVNLEVIVSSRVDRVWLMKVDISLRAFVDGTPFRSRPVHDPTSDLKVFTRVVALRC